MIEKQSSLDSYTDVWLLNIHYWEVKIWLILQTGDMFQKEKLKTLRLEFVFINNFELFIKSSGYLNDMVHKTFLCIFLDFLFFYGTVGIANQKKMHFMNRLVFICPPLSIFKTFGTCNRRNNRFNLCLISLLGRLGC